MPLNKNLDNLLTVFKPPTGIFQSEYITQEQKEFAFTFVIKETQKLFPPEEKHWTDYDLFVNEKGIILCSTRTQNSQLLSETKNPIYLSKKAPLTRFLIMHYHKLVLHSGTALTLSSIRKKFWIPQGRDKVSRTIRKDCRICNKFHSKPFNLPKEPALPESRVIESRPFATIGLDYFGPILIKNALSNIDEKSKIETTKIWVCIYTCQVVRAIHLEIVMDCSTKCFVNAFERFVSRRGKPNIVICDNALQFIAASKILSETEKQWKNLYSDKKLLRYFVNENVDFIWGEGLIWKHITAKAPWRGGFYERLIKEIKKCMRRSLNARISYDLDYLQTFLTKVEAILNSRPITYLYENPKEIRALCQWIF
jgi:hypothetical protein